MVGSCCGDSGGVGMSMLSECVHTIHNYFLTVFGLLALSKSINQMNS